jgi:hypothetical protein
MELQVCYPTVRLLPVGELLKVYINWLSCSVEHPQIHILVICLFNSDNLQKIIIILVLKGYKFKT